MEQREWQQVRHEVQHQLVGHLLERVGEDAYPSSTMLDLIEETIGPDDVADYAEVLMQKIRQDKYPSLDLLKRVHGLI
ncbi:hypothetical protein [Nocardioides sp. LHG3406-4]|uniref:hypothetical protein n=1 Tax=Nocardioides sp. LHG3406-4 TaxID=2804575 RepID=UPI003CF2960F